MLYYVKMESEEVGLQISFEGWERICGSDCNGKCIPEFWGQEGEEFGVCGTLSGVFREGTSSFPASADLSAQEGL